MTAYAFLQDQFKKYNIYKDLDGILMWDSATMMSKGSVEARGEQAALLKLEAQKIITDPKILESLDHAEGEDLNDWQKANLREMRRQVIHENAVDPQLIGALTKTLNKSEVVWRDARKNNDFDAMKPYLEEIFNLNRQIGEAKAEKLGCTTYEALVDEFDPGSDCTKIDKHFDDLADYLPPMIDKIIAKQSKEAALPLDGPFSQDAQKQIGLHLMEKFKFDFDKGRLDVSTHPFCGGSTNDVRITTRYRDNEFFSSMMGIIHETGHALYEQGRPEAYIHQPVSQARGMGVHESQSLFYEKQIGRNPHFIRYILPHLKQQFQKNGEAWELSNVLKVSHKVSRSLIRVDADEVTYPLHIMLRYRMEKGLIEKTYDVKDIPELWNQGMQDLIGITPPNHHDGCLQDIHWPAGLVGYFPSYTMGALIAAQLFASLKKALPDVESEMANGQFDAILEWLRANVHQYGSFYSQEELIIKATGEPLSTEPFKRHVEERYLAS